MKEFLIKNVNLTVRLPLNVLRFAGFWAPDDLRNDKLRFYHFWGVITTMYFLGIYVVIQFVDLYMIWGDLPLMTGDAVLLFTNLAHGSKILNILLRKKKIQRIISECDYILTTQTTSEGKQIVESCNRETSILLFFYLSVTFVTATGWATSSETNQLPLQAWYPYDTTKYPAFQLTYFHQVTALFIAAFLNVCKDTLVATLIAQCTCRLRLLGSALRNLCENLDDKNLITNKSQHNTSSLLTNKQESVVRHRLRLCVEEHQKVLETAGQLQYCFSEPTFLQFMVSLIIVCVTAFQLISQTKNMVRFLSMGTYLLNMMFQLFLYCYQGNQLTEESSALVDSAYDFPWYQCRMETRTALLNLMTRCRRVAKITAGGFTTLSLASFMSIIKSSYSLFTLLKQVDERH